MDPNQPAQSLYDVLQVPRDATPDQIRKAYKKQALLTHPDRLPAGFSPSDKQNAEEQFRKVSNAYEVLKDPENRRLYDMHGVWPPPTQQQEQPYSPRAQSNRHGPRPNRYDTFPDPFVNFFTEPFVLFDKMFSDYRRPSYQPLHRSSSDWRRDPFEAIYRIHDMMADLEPDMFSSNPFPSPFPRSPFVGFETPPFPNRGQVRWAQQSTVVTSRNGVTQSIHKRRDWDVSVTPHLGLTTDD
ncbi:DnaJ domain-containing protein [Mycena sp. CBHHK59/15]|nr:DnaJ domain-containing protein [Mycena sp. CBHHK59/15]